MADVDEGDDTAADAEDAFEAAWDGEVVALQRDGEVLREKDFPDEENGAERDDVNFDLSGWEEGVVEDEAGEAAVEGEPEGDAVEGEARGELGESFVEATLLY